MVVIHTRRPTVHLFSYPILKSRLFMLSSWHDEKTVATVQGVLRRFSPRIDAVAALTAVREGSGGAGSHTESRWTNRAIIV